MIKEMFLLKLVEIQNRTQKKYNIENRRNTHHDQRDVLALLLMRCSLKLPNTLSSAGAPKCDTALHFFDDGNDGYDDVDEDSDEDDDHGDEDGGDDDQ